MPDADFGRRSWLLVGWLVVAFVVAPVAVLWLPPVQRAVAATGLGVRHAYLVVPLVPAGVLGVLAVWAAVGARSADDDAGEADGPGPDDENSTTGAGNSARSTDDRGPE